MELNFKELLKQEKGNFYLVVSRERDIDIFKRQSIMDYHSNFAIRAIRGQRCTTKEELFHEFAAALQFPYWFVPHWQSFDDCITDLSWLHAKNYIFFITNFDKFLTGNSFELNTFFIFMKDAIFEWTKENQGRIIKHPVPLNILFHCEPENEKKCLEILEEQSIKPILKYLKPFDDLK